jgi:Tfp pilus assembly protein PilF
VAEAYSRGEFCIGAGKNDEAIAAFEEVVKIDPTFTEAWQQLAMLYEKKGNSKKAMEAFRRSKKIAVH